MRTQQTLSLDQSTALHGVATRNFSINVERSYNRSRKALERKGLIAFDIDAGRWVLTTAGETAMREYFGEAA